MDLHYPGYIGVDNSGSLQDPSRRTNVEELRQHVEGTTAGLPVAELVQLARSGSVDEVFAGLPRLAEADPRVMSLACEHLQVNLFNRELNESLGERSGLRREQKLNFFRLAQRIREEHGTTRETSPPNCFQSFEDIVELERNIKTNNSADFMIQELQGLLTGSIRGAQPVDGWRAFVNYHCECDLYGYDER